MSGDHKRDCELERRLATILYLGTLAGSCIIAVGWVLAAIGAPMPVPIGTETIIQLGVALFVLLPVLRVLVMAVVFARERDYRLSAIAALVLAIIAAGVALGIHMTGAMPS
jgi:uncharacterized membrane protein